MRFPPHGRPKRCENALQNSQGALRAPPGAHGGPLGLWVLLRFRLALAGHVMEISCTIRSPFHVPESVFKNYPIYFYSKLYVSGNLAQMFCHVEASRTRSARFRPLRTGSTMFNVFQKLHQNASTVQILHPSVMSRNPQI